jgi:hypothetical protein
MIKQAEPNVEETGMSQSFWETEETNKETHAPAEGMTTAESSSLTVSADDFAALEERIVRMVDLVHQARQARAEAEERAAKAEAELRDQVSLLELSQAEVDRLQAEIDRMKAERFEVRGRVEKLAKQLDALEL